MKRLLIIKTTSMGDIVHALPVATDIHRHFPHVQIDWVVEESFQAIPRLSSHVSQIIPVAVRRWRKAWWSAEVRQQWSEFQKRMQHPGYDLVIDLQGLIKSAIVARQAGATIHGYSWHSAKEPWASLCYHHTHQVEPMQAAINRNRKLAALSLGYALSSSALAQCDFGIDTDSLAQKMSLDLPPCFVAVMPSASREAKLWPETHWISVLNELKDRGLVACIFSGNVTEMERAQRLAKATDGVALDPMSLDSAATVLACSQMVIGLDSGLTHLAGALGKPTIGIYGDHPPALAPVVSASFSASLGGKGTPPSLAQVRDAVDQALTRMGR